MGRPVDKIKILNKLVVMQAHPFNPTHCPSPIVFSSLGKHDVISYLGELHYNLFRQAAHPILTIGLTQFQYHDYIGATIMVSSIMIQYQVNAPIFFGWWPYFCYNQWVVILSFQVEGLSCSLLTRQRTYEREWLRLA